MTYRPLPDYLTIKPSKIEGIGLYTLVDIDKGICLGVSHIRIDKNKYPHVDEYVRTPLGGFINHSTKPNLKKVKDRNTFLIYTIENVPMGSELTLQYEWYEIEGDNNDNER